MLLHIGFHMLHHCVVLLSFWKQAKCQKISKANYLVLNSFKNQTKIFHPCIPNS